MPTSRGASSRLGRRFPVLRQGVFLWYLLGMFCNSFGMQARGVIVGWLIYDLTGSALSLGWYIGTWGVSALIFSFVGGAFSDRYGSRQTVLWFRLLSASALLGLYALARTGNLAFWHLLVFNLINGAVSSFEYPARTALLASIVPRDQITTCFGLSYTAMNMASILGPATMGWATDTIGTEWALLITGLVVSVGVFAVIRVRGDECGPVVAARTSSVASNIAEGFRYVLREKNLMAMEVLLLVYVVLLMPYRDIMPAVAADVLGAGASGLGLLSSAMSVGALAGTVIISTVGTARRRGILLVVSALIQTVGVLAFSQSRLLGFSLLALGAAGVGHGLFIPTNNSLLQAIAIPEMRARVVGLNMSVWSLSPLGSILVGGLADQIGPGMAIMASAALALLLFLAAGLLMPQLSRIE